MNAKLRQVLQQGAQDALVPAMADAARDRAVAIRKRRSRTAVVAAVTAIGLFGGYGGLSAAMEPSAPAAGPADGWADLPTELYYTSGDTGPKVVKVVDGEFTTVKMTFEPNPAATWTTSTDGQRWSLTDADGLHMGPLHNEDGELRGDLPADVDVDIPQSCGPQAWSPDGSRLVVGSCESDEGSLLVIDGDNGQVLHTIEGASGMSAEVMKTPYGSVTWLADGERLVWGNYRDGYTIANIDGTNAATFLDPDTIEQVEVKGIQTVPEVVTGLPWISADGRYACVATEAQEDPLADYVSGETHAPSGDGPHEVETEQCSTVLDIEAGVRSPTQFPGDRDVVALDRILFSATGDMLVFADFGRDRGVEPGGDVPFYSMALLNAEGETIAEAEELASLEPHGFNFTGMRF